MAAKRLKPFTLHADDELADALLLANAIEGHKSMSDTIHYACSQYLFGLQGRVRAVQGAVTAHGAARSSAKVVSIGSRGRAK